MENPFQDLRLPDPPPPPDDYDYEAAQQLRQKRMKFFVAAEPLFVRFGFKKTTVEEICAEAGASKRTFYELFKDKTDCFVLLALHVTQEMIDAYRSELTPEMPASQRLDRYLHHYLHTVFNRPIFRQVIEDPSLLKALTSGSATSVQFFEAVNAFTDIVNYGMSTGEFRQMSPDAITWIVHSLLDGLYLLGSDAHPNPGEVESPEFEKEVFAFIRHGLGVHDE